MTWSPRWSSVTWSPRWIRFSAISRPMKPPPTTTARLRRHHRLESRVGVHAGGQRRVPFNPLADRLDVRHGPHPKDARQIDAGQGRADRRCAGGEDELVVGLGGHLAGRRHCADRTVFFSGEIAIASQRVRTSMANCSRNVCSRRHQQARLAGDHAADMVGQPAVRVRNVRSAFHHEDFRIFIQPAQARRTRRAAGHAANDDDLHPC